MIRRLGWSILLILIGLHEASAADEEGRALSFSTFLSTVAQANLELAAQRLNVPIAEAQVSVARIFPDPVIAGGLAQIDVSGQQAPAMSTLGITLPIEIGGKRGARVAAAKADVSVARADLEDFLRKLRADSATAYVNALYVRLVLERKRRTLESLEKLVSVNQQRLRAGDIGEVALIQSRVEAQRYRGDVLAAEAEVKVADLSLRQFLGSASPPRGTAVEVRGELRIAPRSFEADTLIKGALAERPDVRSRRLFQTAADARVQLARANRWVDVTLNVSWQRSLYSEPFASPQFDALGATLSLPLPFSRIYHGELDAARQTFAQAEHTVHSVELKATVEIDQALCRYQAAVKQVDLYTHGVLADADKVNAATLYTYERGGATLLEVLTAQRTVDEVYLAYYDALAEHARQLIAVEQTSGIWDIQLP